VTIKRMDRSVHQSNPGMGGRNAGARLGVYKVEPERRSFGSKSIVDHPALCASTETVPVELEIQPARCERCR
jgi:hypothetical protein